MIDELFSLEAFGVGVPKLGLGRLWNGIYRHIFERSCAIFSYPRVLFYLGECYAIFRLFFQQSTD